MLPGSLAPRQQEHLVHLASWMPFDKAAQMIEEILGVQTNEETVRQLTERMGTSMEAAQAAESDPPSSQESKEQPAPQRCAFSADGAMVSLVKKQWAETRTVAIGEPHEKRNADGETEIHVGHLSYFSRLTDAFTFTNLAEVEVQRRNVAQAKEVCAVMDGADWLQCFTDKHRPDALRILDFPHAAEHVTKLLEALEKAGMQFPPHMLDRCLHILKHRGPRPLLRLADRLERDLVQQKGVQEHLEYLRKREALMQYPEFHSLGWPIGSGMVESANKNVVEARLKGPGMHWERKHVNPMLALRNTVCNGRWQEMWQKAVLHHRKLQSLQRSARAGQRATSPLPTCNPPSCPDSSSTALPSAASQEFSPPVSFLLASEERSLPAPPSPPVTRPSSCRPSARRKRHTARKQVKYSHQKSAGVSADVCPCGTPLVRFKGHRPKQYCSDRCRQHAYRKQHTQTKPGNGSSRAPSSHRQKSAAVLQVSRARVSSQRSGGVRGETCLFCGTRLLQSMGGRKREYCSGRCRQRAHRERQALASCA